ncbi:MAG: hypothetical protein WDN03_03930 [Rhizomicrobium sp.]
MVIPERSEVLKMSNQIFFATNSKPFESGDEPSTIFADTASELGFRPIPHAGLGLQVRTAILDREVRQNFYEFPIIVLYLGRSKEGSGPRDNWALPEMTHALEMKKACLVYTAPDFPEEVLREYGIAGVAKTVRDSDDYRQQLTTDLKSLKKA